MLKAKLSSLLFAVLASMSLAVSAAETQTQSAPVVESAEVAPVGKVNLNTADAATLQRELLGIGEVKAQAPGRLLLIVMSMVILLRWMSCWKLRVLAK